jgi:cyclopropane fatty-acyl-phospholipid synthase-like methyltransferase
MRYKDVQNIEFVQANLLGLNYESLFDYIVSFETVEHLQEEDIPELFRVFSRALKSGGTLIFSTPYMQEMTVEAINMGFHLSFYIDEVKIKRWLSAGNFVCEYFKYQNHQTHNIEDHLDKKDFIICVARSY